MIMKNIKRNLNYDKKKEIAIIKEKYKYIYKI